MPAGDRREEGAGGEGHDPITAYDELAATYREDLERNAYNADLEFPGTTALLPDVAGKRVLDACCGAGRYAEWLDEQGADVVGFDASEEMLERARDRLDDGVTLHHARLEDPLAFADDGAFDGVVCGLALDYVTDWERPLGEFARVLAPGGFLVVSVTHPLDEFPLPDGSDYFAVESREKEWEVPVSYYRRPLSAVVNPLLEAGFDLEEVTEPRPTERFAERRPDRYETERRNPVFLCFRARAPGGDSE